MTFSRFSKKNSKFTKLFTFKSNEALKARVRSQDTWRPFARGKKKKHSRQEFKVIEMKLTLKTTLFTPTTSTLGVEWISIDNSKGQKLCLSSLIGASANGYHLLPCRKPSALRVRIVFSANGNCVSWLLKHTFVHAF